MPGVVACVPMQSGEEGVTVDWLRENLLWIAAAVLFIWMHTKMHGAHGGQGGGGHGGCGAGGHDGHEQHGERGREAHDRSRQTGGRGSPAS